ncbi:MAG: DUF86 domain-containing protein [Thermoplasmata archaeon]
MPKKRDEMLYFEDMLDAIERIEAYTHGLSFEEFNNDRKTRDAVVYNLGIIGEAAKSVPEEIKNRHKEIEWKDIIGMRDKLFHDYLNIDARKVWDTLQRDIPTLEIRIKAITKKYGTEKTKTDEIST